MKFHKFLLISVFILTGSNVAWGQQGDTLNVDEAFMEARNLAFNGKRDEAKNLCRRILVKSPGYSDVKVLLGRIHTWSGNYDSARVVLKEIIVTKPYEDAYIALTDLERWDDQNPQSVLYANEGLKYFPDSKELMLKKAQATENTGAPKEAYQIIDTLLRKYPDYTEARVYAARLNINGFSNKIGVSYNFDHFDKRYSDNWQLVSPSYSRRLKHFGSVIVRANYANRFKKEGWQYEVDAYPGVGNKMYAYLNFGYSGSSLFPQYRMGASLYRSFPKSFEGELGIRYLQFANPTILYTGSIGKYYKNYWFSFRPLFIKSDYALRFSQRFSQSYTLIIRYYFRTADDYFTLTVGNGVSPDDRSMQTLLENPSLQSRKIQAGYQQKFFNRYIFSLSAGLLNEQYYIGPSAVAKGNDYSFGVGLQRIF